MLECIRGSLPPNFRTFPLELLTLQIKPNTESPDYIRAFRFLCVTAELKLQENHALLTLLEAITLALDVNDGTVMQHTVKDSGSNRNVSKHIIPLGESLVRCEDC